MKRMGIKEKARIEKLQKTWSRTALISFATAIVGPFVLTPLLTPFTCVFTSYDSSTVQLVPKCTDTNIYTGLLIFTIAFIVGADAVIQFRELDRLLTTK